MGCVCVRERERERERVDNLHMYESVLYVRGVVIMKRKVL
jgi:hypothetical protein